MTSINMIISFGLLGFLVVLALGAVLARNLLVSLIMMGIFSLVMALSYVVYQAPDVAMTEAAIGAGIATILFLAALQLTGHNEQKTKRHIIPLIVVFITGSVIFYATLHMPQFGDPNAPVQQYLAPYYLTQSYKEIEIPNVVTSILASYRGYDTMGECFVVFTAGIAVLMLIGGRRKQTLK